jgi:hypothetical protein
VGRLDWVATRLAKRIGQDVAFDLPFGDSCLIRPGRKAGIMAIPQQDVERKLVELGQATERLVEGVHFCWLRECAEDGSREFPSSLRLLAKKVENDLRDLVGHGLSEAAQGLAIDVATHLIEAWAAYERKWMGSEHLQLLRSIDAAGVLSQETEEAHSPLASPNWSQFREAYLLLLAGLPESLAVWADVGSLLAQSHATGQHNSDRLRVLARAFPTWSLRRVLEANRDKHPAAIDINFHLEPFGVSQVRRVGDVQDDAAATSPDEQDDPSLPSDGRSSVDDEPANKDHMTVEEANQIAMQLAKKDRSFVHATAEEWARKISEASGTTCSPSTVHKTALWKATTQKTGYGRTKDGSPGTVTFTKKLDAATEVLDKQVQVGGKTPPTITSVTVVTGENRYALAAESRQPFSVPPNLHLMFSLFVQKILKGVPSERVLWYELNRSMGVDDAKLKSASGVLRTAMNELRKALDDWGKPQDGRRWLLTKKGEGLWLNESVKWTVAPEVAKDLTERKSPWVSATDPVKMAETTDSRCKSVSENRETTRRGQPKPGDDSEN